MTSARTFQTKHLAQSIFALALLLNLSLCNVIGFDFGSTFFKITLVKPGQPFTIVENTATKRKTETMLTLNPDDARIMGADSYMEQSKYPKTTFHSLHRFVGVKYEDAEPIIKERYVMNEIKADERGFVGWVIQRKLNQTSDPVEEIAYTEELIGQLLKYGKQMSEKQAGGQSIKDCVITIPAYYTTGQKRMILDSAEIAGLSVLQLVHENTAAATMFGIDRMDREKPVIVLFYNMGAMDTEVSLVRYSAITEQPSNKTYEHIEILGEAWDSQLGSADLDTVLLNMLAERFNAMKERQGKPDVRENPKVIKRLLKEVVKYKDILSANKQVQVKLGELADYVTLSTIIERGEFEEKSAEFFTKVMKPVEDVLAKAGVTIEEVDMVELLGGGIRVPKIQELLQEKLQKKDLGVHLNGDEAMCFGSAFIASNSSASFKVRKVFLTQHPATPISIRISPLNATKVTSQSETESETVSQDADSNDDEQGLKEVTQNSNGIKYEQSFKLYKLTDYLGLKKNLNLYYDTNMKIDVYAGLDSEGDRLATFTVNGIDEIAASDLMKKENVTRPRVSLQFELTRTGLLQLNKVDAKVEETYWQEITPVQNKTKKSKNANKENNDTSSDTNSTEETPATPTEPPKPEKVQKKRTIPYSLNRIERVQYGPASLTKEQIQKAKERLRWFEKRDEEKAKTDKAKNDFETVIYAMRAWVSEYPEHMPYIGTTEEQEEILGKLSSAEEWLLDGEGEYATYQEYNTKFEELDKIFSALKSRKEEHKRRPKIVQDAHRRLEELEDETKDLAEKKPWINETYRQEVLDRITDLKKWLEESVEKQEALKLSEEPAFRSSEVDFKITSLNRIFTRISSMPKPKEKKPPVKGKKNKNFKIENITIDGNSGDQNWEDFVTINNNDEEDQTTSGGSTNEEQKQQSSQQEEPKYEEKSNERGEEQQQKTAHDEEKRDEDEKKTTEDL